MANISFIGNLGKDAELKEVGKRQYVVFNVGESRKYTDSNGQQQTSTTWFRCMKQDSSGKICQFLSKGTRVYVCGELRISTYQGKDGQTHYDNTVWVNNFEFMSSRSGNYGGQRQQNVQNNNQPPKDLYQYATQGKQSQPTLQAIPEPDNGGGDLFPF